MSRDTARELGSSLPFRPLPIPTTADTGPLAGGPRPPLDPVERIERNYERGLITEDEREAQLQHLRDSEDRERDPADDDTVTVSKEALDAFRLREQQLQEEITSLRKRTEEAEKTAAIQKRAAYEALSTRSFFTLQIGGPNQTVPPDTTLLFTRKDPSDSARTILFIPVFLNPRAVKGRPYSVKARDPQSGQFLFNPDNTPKMETRYNYDLGRTRIVESLQSHLILTPNGPKEVTLSGMAIVNMSSRDVLSVMEHLEDDRFLAAGHQGTSPSGAHVDDTDSISTTGTFTPSLANQRGARR